MKKVKAQIKKATISVDEKDKKDFIAFIKEKDPEAYRVAVEKGWLESILQDIGVGHNQPVHSNTTTN